MKIVSLRDLVHWIRLVERPVKGISINGVSQPRTGLAPLTTVEHITLEIPVGSEKQTFQLDFGYSVSVVVGALESQEVSFEDSLTRLAICPTDLADWIMSTEQGRLEEFRELFRVQYPKIYKEMSERNLAKFRKVPDE